MRRTFAALVSGPEYGRLPSSLTRSGPGGALRSRSVGYERQRSSPTAAAWKVAVVVDEEIVRRGLVSTFEEDPMIDVVVETADGLVDAEGVDVAFVSWPATPHLELRCPQVVLASSDGFHSIPRSSEIAAILRLI